MDDNETNCDTDPEYVPDEPDKEEEDTQEHETEDRKGPSIWTHFIKVPPASEKRARCSLCFEIKSFKTTTTNLKMHLKYKHPTAMKALVESKRKSSSNLSEIEAIVSDDDITANQVETDYKPAKRIRSYGRSSVWRHFEKLKPYHKRIARCKYCLNTRSYRTSISNLKVHLSMKHLEKVQHDEEFVYKSYLFGKQRERQQARKLSRTAKIWDLLQTATENDDNDTNETGNVKFSSEILRHFDVEEDEATCGLCRDSIPSGLEDMKNHLEETHSNVLDDIMQKVLDAASDEDHLLGDDEMYTEVVYLEDEPKKTNDKPEQKRKLKPQPKISKFKTERQSSTSSEEFILKPKQKRFYTETKEPEELDMFVNYITVLLKKVPKESSQKLHLDIINLIMSATQPQNKVTIETANAIAKVSEVETSIVLQNNTNTSDTNINTTNTRVLTIPVLSLPQNDKKNTMSQVVVTNTSGVNISDARVNTICEGSLSMPEITVFTDTNTR